ncbi:hypothetical protein KAX14_03005 [Candidatus Bipolaricaulota bacterium]|nr:hypothetical protein [Candidatus Bipolaricaulota bacterium]
MDRSNKAEKKEKVLRDPFEWFASDEELREAIDNLRCYLEALKSWDELEKKQRIIIIPPETLN